LVIYFLCLKATTRLASISAIYGGVASVAVSNAGQFIPQRLQNIVDLIPNSYASCADIGTDHGLLAVALTSKVTRVHATDQSPSAASNARELFSSCNLSDAISLDIGFGMRPLLTRIPSTYPNVDVCILSGMGSLAALQILCNDEHAKFTFSDDESSGIVDCSSFDISIVDRLGVQQLVLQPWPPNIVAVHYLQKILMSNGWRMDSQRICMSEGKRENMYHHLATSFVRSAGMSRDLSLSDTLVFNSSPISTALMETQSLGQNKYEFVCWIDYLSKQRVTLENRLKGLEQSKVLIASNSDLAEATALPLMLMQAIDSQMLHYKKLCGK
jgi:tRNA A22 N-methylase